MQPSSLIVVVSLLSFCQIPASAGEKPSKPASEKASVNKTADAEAKATTGDEDKAADGAAEKNRRFALRSDMIVKVVSPDDAKAAIREEAARLNGFMTYSDNSMIVVKLPPKNLAGAMKHAAETGTAIDKKLNREDLTQRIGELEGRLKSKKEILSRLRSFFDSSDVAATLEVERSMTDLLFEIEQVTGQLRVLCDRADWAQLKVAFEFREQDKVVYVSSPFEWLNTASLDVFLEEFQP